MMTGPGEYIPDPTEGITCVKDLPQPQIVRRRRSFKRRKCPRCGHSAVRGKTFTRTLHDWGDVASNRPRDLVITYSQHHCSPCGKYFNADLSDLAIPNSHYTKKRIESKIADLFDHRHRLVQHPLTAAERKTLRRITRGQSALRALRQIVDEVYRLFDRRCRTDTALAKLARLRQRVSRFQGLRHTLNKRFSPTLEKALTFLDDSLLPATSNAVERGNRRYRKMQKTVYRVRTGPHLSQRIAGDMLRDAQAQGRSQTTQTLHYARAG
jgi:transcription elongation factor Elf1